MKKLISYRFACLLLAIQQWNVERIEAFVPLQQQTSRFSRLPGTLLEAASSVKVDRMLQLLPQNEMHTDELRDLFEELAQSTEDDVDVNSLYGEYEVATTIPTEESQRPVGGKWSKWKSFMAWQHIVQPKIDGSIAQVINLIRLHILWITIHVMLRGDAYSVRRRTVRADFEAPRIILQRRWALSLGPPSSVTLETPYCDDRLRLGQGSRGSRFVFVRTKMQAEDDWRPLYELKTVGKRGLISGLLTLTITGALASGYLKVATAIGLVAATVVIRSTGGIEMDDDDVRLADKAS
jgi:hypothetical protein